MNKRARKVELKQVLNSVYYRGEVTKPELAEEFGVSLTAMSNYVNLLQRGRWLRSTEKGESTGGRKPLLYQLNPSHRYILGINLRYNHFYLFLADLHGSILGTQLVMVGDCSFENYITMICTATKALLTNLGVGKERVLGMGICISGVTDFDNRVVDRSRELNWDYMPIGQV